MVTLSRLFLVTVVVLIFNIPTFAQDDYPGMEVAMAYANVDFPINMETGLIESNRHSGFAMHTGFNFKSWLGIENYTGVSGLGRTFSGQKTTMINNIFGVKVAFRAARVTPYAVAGFGISYLTDEATFGSSNMATRLAVGVDIPINDSFAWKIDVGKMAFNLDQWRSGTALSTGIVFTIR